MVDPERVLVVNAGSSSLKLAVVDEQDRSEELRLERWDGSGGQDAVRDLLARAGPVQAVGHRVVHGGPGRDGPALVDDALLAELEALTPLAPLHQPAALAGLRAARELLPDLPAVACFDTAFHAGLPAAASTYALPGEWNQRFGLRRYGFHRLSHAWASRRAAEVVGRPVEELRVVSCHLGAGASLCAVVGGRSVDTTMGFTPLEGLVMATRSGSVDPGLLLWLLRSGGVPVDELANVLEHRSGLAGLSGTSGDLRDVLDAADGGDEAAGLAYDVLLHRLVGSVGAMSAAAGGLDVLVLTGGIGERSARLRADLVPRLAHLGLALDPALGEGSDDRDLSAAGAQARTVVVASREDLQVAREVRTLLTAP